MSVRGDTRTPPANSRGADVSGAYILSAIAASLAAFVAVGLRPRTPFAKAIVLILVIKLIGIAGIKMFMFPDGAQPIVDAAAMAQAIGPVIPPR